MGARCAHGRRSFEGVGKGQCELQRFFAAAGCDSNVDKILRHVIFDARQLHFMADVVVGGMTLQFTRRCACGNYLMRNFDFPCVLDEFFVYKFFGGSIVGNRLLVT